MHGCKVWATSPTQQRWAWENHQPLWGAATGLTPLILLVGVWELHLITSPGAGGSVALPWAAHMWAEIRQPTEPSPKDQILANELISFLSAANGQELRQHLSPSLADGADAEDVGPKQSYQHILLHAVGPSTSVFVLCAGAFEDGHTINYVAQ